MKTGLLICFLIITAIITFCSGENGGSKCPNTVCTSAPSGMETKCDARYGERGNGCCPVWHCKDANGGTYTVYGVSSAGGGGSSSSSSSFGSSFSSSGGNGGMPPMNLPFGGGFFNMFGR